MVGRVGALRLVAYAMCVSSAACIGQFLLLRQFAFVIQLPAVYGLSFVNAVLYTVLPAFMTMIAVARIGASGASQASMVGPVSMLFLGAAILDEPLAGVQIAGMLLVLSGIYLLSRKRAA